jgi:hypothetical protein
LASGLTDVAPALQNDAWIQDIVEPLTVLELIQYLDIRQRMPLVQLMPTFQTALSGDGALQVSTPHAPVTPPCSLVSMLSWVLKSSQRPGCSSNVGFSSGLFFMVDVGHQSVFRDTVFATIGHALCAPRMWSPLIIS